LVYSVAHSSGQEKKPSIFMQANAEPDLAQTGNRLRPVMAALIQGILDIFLPSIPAGGATPEVISATNSTTL